MWFSSDITTALQAQATASGTLQGSVDSVWLAWQNMMQQHQKPSSSVNSFPKLNFWLVVSLPGDDYSEKLEWHHEIPMLIPASGTGRLLGLARTKPELDAMLLEDSQSKRGKTGNIHLTYKVKIQGQESWRSLLEFLATHDMLEKET
jgi:hypothetical protein